MTTLDVNLERGFTVNCKRDNFNFESFYGPKTHLTESGTQPDLIRVWAGFFFVEDNSDNLGEKNVAIESFKPVDDGGILGEVDGAAEVTGTVSVVTEWGNTKLN